MESVFKGNLIGLEIDGIIYFHPIGTSTFHYVSDKELLKSIFDIKDENLLILITHYDTVTEETKLAKIKNYRRTGLKFLE